MRVLCHELVRRYGTRPRLFAAFTLAGVSIQRDTFEGWHAGRACPKQATVDALESVLKTAPKKPKITLA